MSNKTTNLQASSLEDANQPSAGEHSTSSPGTGRDSSSAPGKVSKGSLARLFEKSKYNAKRKDRSSRTGKVTGFLKGVICKASNEYQLIMTQVREVTGVYTVQEAMDKGISMEELEADFGGKLPASAEVCLQTGIVTHRQQPKYRSPWRPEFTEFLTRHVVLPIPEFDPEIRGFIFVEGDEVRIQLSGHYSTKASNYDSPRSILRCKNAECLWHVSTAEAFDLPAFRDAVKEYRKMLSALNQKAKSVRAAKLASTMIPAAFRCWQCGSKAEVVEQFMSEDTYKIPRQLAREERVRLANLRRGKRPAASESQKALKEAERKSAMLLAAAPKIESPEMPEAPLCGVADIYVVRDGKRVKLSEADGLAKIAEYTGDDHVSSVIDEWGENHARHEMAVDAFNTRRSVDEDGNVRLNGNLHSQKIAQARYLAKHDLLDAKWRDNPEGWLAFLSATKVDPDFQVVIADPKRKKSFELLGSAGDAAGRRRTSYSTTGDATEADQRRARSMYFDRVAQAAVSRWTGNVNEAELEKQLTTHDGSKRTMSYSESHMAKSEAYKLTRDEATMSFTQDLRENGVTVIREKMRAPKSDSDQTVISMEMQLKNALKVFGPGFDTWIPAECLNRKS